MEFCKAFDAQTQKVEPGLPLPVVITAYADKSFTLHHQDAADHGADQEGAPASSRAARSRTPTRWARSRASRSRRSPRQKMPDLNAADLEAAMRIVAGSARSMGVIVEGM